MKREISITLAAAEVPALTDLVSQLQDLAYERDPGDAAIGRLTPTVYPDDPAAATEFRRLTQHDLLDRRMADAGTVLAGLADLTTADDLLTADAPATSVEITLDSESVEAWLRTLSALRLIIASRLGIETDDDPHDQDDPRFAVYDWLAYRLDGLVQAADALD